MSFGSTKYSGVTIKVLGCLEKYSINLFINLPN